MVFKHFLDKNFLDVPKMCKIILRYLIAVAAKLTRYTVKPELTTSSE
jgi:hypothetical protein